MKLSLLTACLIGALLFSSCVAVKPKGNVPHPAYKSDDYIIHKLEKETSIAELARRYLGDEKQAWKIEDTNNFDTLGDSQLIAIPLKEKNRGGLFETGYQSVPILCYHQFGDNKNSSMFISAELFDQQMRYLKQNGYRVISPQTLSHFLEYEKQIPQKAVLITIDDGYKSVYDIAWPILKRYGFTATLFIYTDYVGISKKALSWEDLRVLKADGFTIGSHSVSHSDMTKKEAGETDVEFAARVRTELYKSKQIIDKKLAQDTKVFSFPYGRYNPGLLKKAQKAGYSIAVTVERGSNPFFANPLALKRDMILKKDMKTFITRLKTFNTISLK